MLPQKSSAWALQSGLPPPLKGWPFKAERDWVSLLNQVSDKLKASVTDAISRGKPMPGQISQLIGDCVHTMEALQPDLVQERSRRWQLELDVFDAHTALAQSRAELLGSQAGERRARHLATHDGLTSLANKDHFIQRLQQVLAHARPTASGIAVFFIDLDDFKAVNDQHGHCAGDELLSITATRLTRALRADDLVSRWGGDEFTCLLMNVPDPQRLGQLACKLFDAISATVKIGDFVFNVRPSIGLATYTEAGLSAADLLHRADLAMYHAKREQTGYAFFRPDQDAASTSGN